MDQYTQETKLWLDERFRKCDEQGIYFAHQPIYGFRKGHAEPGHIDKYVRTYQIMKALAHLRFDSLLDVGGAEGYTAYVAKQIFGVRAKSSDLSEEACLRAREIFHIDSAPADIHELPYIDDEFDVALCTATLEHVVDYRKAINELLRVATKAVVVVVPCEDRARIERNIREKIPHAHIHGFTLSSFDFLKSQGYDIIRKGIGSRSLIFFSDYLIEPYPRQRREGIARYLKSFVDICVVPILKRMYGSRIASLVLNLDGLICNLLSYRFMLFTILKDKSCYHQKEMQKISASQILNLTVPYHYLNRK